MSPESEFFHPTLEKVEEMKAGGRECKNPFVSIEQLEAECYGDPLLEEILHDTLEQCDRYTETVLQFEQVILRGLDANADGTRAEIDGIRKRVHDTTIEQINILARSLRKAGRNTDWLTKVTVASRAGYAKFALTTSFERIQAISV
ncbi:MAG: hypothetical protein WCO79_03025 [bacterium]